MRVLVFGTFDRLHPGHHFVLDEASTRGQLFVVVARDSSVERIKGKRASQSQEERLAVLEEEYPDATVLLGDEEDFLVPVRNVQPDLILLGYDQRMPPGVTESDLPCPVERLPSFHPEQYKSSLL